MPFNLNRIELIGRLGRDPELHYTAEGHAVAKFSLATDRPVKADSPAETDWHQIICWRGLAEFAGEYLTKGRLVFVAGRLTYRTWEGKDGQKRHASEIVANQLILLDRRPEATPRDLGGAVEGDDLPF
ncbi:single-stranded DNA-binding protein [Nitrolancea hollandica]|uniref:Single-stranded DNA-binding protein n=1 Tax=Nitrolancea hollandica Lb TaxID=1129897 RepID=I4EL78_9BACT|nr:single-stranded DNA-binding protein [Nitrolancea hollandica]CCF85440.1 Single-stranded DNA-binding protein [Nitrolancea hollandica Lb]